MKKLIPLILIFSSSLAIADSSQVKQQFIEKTQQMGGDLKSICQTNMSHTPDELAQQYNQVMTGQPDQVENFKQLLKFCISNGYIPESVLK